MAGGAAGAEEETSMLGRCHSVATSDGKTGWISCAAQVEVLMLRVLVASL